MKYFTAIEARELTTKSRERVAREVTPECFPSESEFKVMYDAIKFAANQGDLCLYVRVVNPQVRSTNMVKAASIDGKETILIPVNKLSAISQHLQKHNFNVQGIDDKKVMISWA